MDPILSYIKDGQLPADPFEVRMIRVKSARFTIMNDELYNRGFCLPYLNCLNSEEAMYVLQEIYEGICGNNLGSRSLVGKVIQEGYLWLNMQKDTIELVQRCDKCQQFGNSQHTPGELMINISSPWPFATWGIDIISPLPQGKKQVKFLLVAINYFTK